MSATTINSTTPAKGSTAPASQPAAPGSGGAPTSASSPAASTAPGTSAPAATAAGAPAAGATAAGATVTGATANGAATTGSATAGAPAKPAARAVAPAAQEKPVIHDNLAIWAYEVVNELVRRLKMEEGLRRRRRDPRYGLQGAVPVSDSRGSPHFKPLFIAAGVDMSYQGIGLMTPEAMKVGAIYYVNLRNFGKEQYVLPLRVVHCNMMARGMFRVGAQLLQ